METKTPAIDLSLHPKQHKYFNAICERLAGKNQHSYFAYGGAIRGGKTYITLASLILLTNKYHGSRWHVIRKDLPVLLGTTIPSFEKLIGKSENWRMVRDKGNYHAVNVFGSKIFFQSEDIQRDPELNDFLGLETNGIFLEQAEELSEKMWQKALERTGSWYLPDMPPGFIFLTFNPTQSWVKDLIYEPWREGRLSPEFYFESALPKDNPFVTADQWRQWGSMAERYRLQFIEGDWSDMRDTNNLWAYAFDRAKHMGAPEYNPEQALHLSFDFNRNPICCTVIQHYDKHVYVLETIKLANSNIYHLCDAIKVKYPASDYIVTGDATGQNGNALAQNGYTYYRAIETELRVNSRNFRLPRANPSLEKNHMLVNSILEHYTVTIHSKKAEALIYDMRNVRLLPDGTINKGNRKDPAQQADALDTFRYWCNVHLGSFKARR